MHVCESQPAAFRATPPPAHLAFLYLMEHHAREVLLQHRPTRSGPLKTGSPC